MAGISLEFKQDGSAKVKQDTLPLCMGWIPCEHLTEILDESGDLKIHHQVCKILGKSVFEIFDTICITRENPCPRSIWYCAKESWYYHEKKRVG